MGFFSSSESFERHTIITGPVSKAQLITSLQDIDFFIRTNPHYISHAPFPPKDAKILIPQEVLAKATGPVQTFKTEDAIPGQYAKLLPGLKTSSGYIQIVLVPDGIFSVLQAALDVVVKREFRILGEEGGLELVEVGGADANKLAMGAVRKQGEENWTKIHRGVVERVGGIVGAQTLG